MKKIKILILFLLSFALTKAQNYSNLSNVVISGLTGHSVTQAVTGSNLSGVTFEDFTFSGIFGDCFTFESGTLNNIQIIRNTATNIHGRFIMLGGWNGNLSNNIEIACNTVNGTDNSDVFFLCNAHGLKVHHNDLNNIGTLDAGSEDDSHEGVFFIRLSDGDFYNNRTRNAGGNNFRVWGRTATGSTRAAVNIYNNINVGGRKYSFIEANGAEVGTNSFDLAVYNNTAGNLSPGSYTSAGLTIYGLTGSTVSFTNNIVFNTSAGLISQEGGSPSSVAGSVYYATMAAAGWASVADVRLPDGGNWSDGGTCSTPPPTVAPPTPTLASPANGATSQPLTITLSWLPSSDADSYTYQIATDAGFTAIVATGTVGSTSVSVSGLANNTLHYWRVLATNTAGSSGYTAARTFTTVVSVTLPGAPTITSPANLATGVSTTTTVSWTAAGGETGFRVQAATDAGFSTIIYDNSGVTGTAITEQTENGLTLYVRVAGLNEAGQGAWSGTVQFTIGNAAPDPPLQNAPSNGAQGVLISASDPASPTLSYGPAAGTNTYQVQVSLSNTFGVNVYDSSGIATITIYIPGLSNYTTYYWRVRTTGPGGTSAWSSTFSFTTLISVPSISSPATGVSEQGLNPVFDWADVPGAASYTFQLSTDSLFGTYIINQAAIVPSQYQATGLSIRTRYYARALAVNSGGSSAFSGIIYITTEIRSYIITSGSSIIFKN